MNSKIFIFFVIPFFFLSCSEDPIDDLGTGSISGSVVVKGANTPLENVKISTNPVSNTVFTNANGEFLIEEAQVGEYSVQANFDGYVTAFKAARVDLGRVNNVVFELEVSTANNRAPGVPQLITPEDKSLNVPTALDFVWTSGKNDEDDLSYKLILRNVSQNTSQQFEMITDTTFNVANLMRDSQYVWQVEVNDNVNDPVLSALSQFKTVGNPNNPFLYTRLVNNNAVIYSSDKDATDVVMLTSGDENSFRPRKNQEVGKIAFLKTVGGNTHIFTMNLDGTNQTQITSAIPVNGFRVDELDFSWAQNGSKIYYPNFDKLYSINSDGSGRTLIYQTVDGSFISEVATTDLNDNLIVVKTNNNNGYESRIFTVNLSSKTEGQVILENQPGASGGLDIDANGSVVIFTRDISGSQNSSYRIFRSRLFSHNLATGVTTQLVDNTNTGLNDLDPRFSPSEGQIIFTRVPNNIGATPDVLTFDLSVASTTTSAIETLFTNAFMPDWE